MTQTETPVPLEIERKFLVSEHYQDLTQYVGKVIHQGYVAIDENGTEVRLRNNQGEYTETVKTNGELVRGEWETQLNEEQFAMLWPTTEGRRLEKTRYAIPYGVHTIELDIFRGKLSGLLLAEVEFTTVAVADAFVLPTWFGKDVTSDKQYKNKNLAVRGLPS